MTPKSWIMLGVALVSIGMIGVGVAMIHPPAALIVVGSLIWVDLLRWTARAGGRP